MADKVVTRPATRQDFLDFFGKLPPYTLRAQVMESGGRVVGIGGYWMAGNVAVVFSDLVEDHGVSRFTIFRTAKKYMEDLKK